MQDRGQKSCLSASLLDLLGSVHTSVATPKPCCGPAGQQMQKYQGGVVNSTLVATMIREDVRLKNLQIAIYSDLKLSSFFIANKFSGTIRVHCSESH